MPRLFRERRASRPRFIPRILFIDIRDFYDRFILGA